MSLLVLRRLAWLLVVASPCLASPSVAAAVEYVSHQPTRPLPQASNRPLAAGPAKFVDVNRGDDAADGS